MSRPVVVCVCGGRDFTNRALVHAMLDQQARWHGRIVVLTGGAPGADTYAEQWDGPGRAATISIRADWARHGKAAGPIRNQALVDYGPDLVLAFRGGRGTANMVKQAEAAGIRVHRAG